MRKFLLPAALVVSLATGSAALAAQPSGGMSSTQPAAASKAKASECAKQWKAQKKHSQTRKAFLAACEKG